MFCGSLGLTRIDAVMLNIATMDHFLQSQVSKNSLKKGYIEMLKSYFLETLKSALGSSINYYWPYQEISKQSKNQRLKPSLWTP